MNPELTWYLTRATGLVAWTLLVATLIWGVLLATRVLRPRDQPAWLLDLHRWMGGLTLGLTGLHLVSLYADSFVEFSIADFLIPFNTDYKPIGVAFGVVSLYLLAAVQVSSLVIRRLSKSWWRRVHMASFGLVVTVALHGFLTGTDTTRMWYLVATIALCILPTIAIAVRILRPKHSRSLSQDRPRPRPQPARRRHGASAVVVLPRHRR